MADNAFLTKRSLILAKIEVSTQYGIDSNPTVGSYDAIRLLDAPTIDLGQETVDVTGGNLSRGYGRPIGTVRPAGVTFRTFVTGIEAVSYSATQKPPIGDLLRSCGMFETFATSGAGGDQEYRYAPCDDVGSDASMTIVAHRDGFEHRLVGCRGNVNFIFQAANPVIAEFTFRGQLTTEATTLRASPTLTTVQPPRWIDSGTIYMNSYVAHVENLNLNTNNTLLEQRASVAASGSGILQVLITERKPGGSMDPEAVEQSSFDFFGVWRSSSGFALRLNAGTVKGNRFTLTASQVCLQDAGWGDNSGLALFQTDYLCAERSKNDEYLITFS